MHKRTAITIIVLLVGILIVVFALVTRHIRLQSPIVFLDEPQRVVTGDATVPVLHDADGDIVPAIASDMATARALGADQAHLLYAQSRLEIGEGCRVDPSTFVTSVQKIVLLDNRTDVMRDIVIGPRTYTVGANDYVLAAFSKPGEFTVSCGRGTAGGTLIVTES